MNAPNINLKEILGKLSFLKNNLALLVPVIIAIVALLLLIPASLFGRRLRKQVQEGSLRKGQAITSLARDLEDATEIDVGEGKIEALRQDANEIEAMVTHSVMRELLRYDIFPDANETSLLLFERFSDRYRAGVDAMLAEVGAGVCPDTDELQKALKSARPAVTPGMSGAGYDPAYGVGMDATLGMGGGDLGGMGGYGGGMGGSRLTQLSPLNRQIVYQVCASAAKGVKLYATSEKIAGYAFWETWEFIDRDTAFRDCWYWQLGYWVIEDIMTTIQTMNANSTSVLDAPVKRLMDTSFTLKKSRRRASRGSTFMRYGQKVTQGGSSGNNPSYVKTSQDVMTLPCTGRVTNEEIDVIQFSFRVIVDASQVIPFMQELCSVKEHKFRGFYGDNEREETYEHNQISILESGINAVEKTSYTHELYSYGDAPAVELDLICEYVFPKVPAFDKLKPPQVVADLEETE